MLHKINNFLTKYQLHIIKDILLFMLITIFLHILFKKGLHLWVRHYEFYNALNLWLAGIVFDVSLWINQKILSLDIITIGNIFLFENHGYISIDEGCSGLKLFYQWTLLMLVFPGPWKHKAWFIPAGLIIVFLTNIFRIVSLSVVLLWDPSIWHFTHDWILRPLFYVVMFLMWVFWVERIKNRNKI